MEVVIQNIIACMLGYLVFQLAYILSYFNFNQIFDIQRWLPSAIRKKYLYIILLFSIVLSFFGNYKLNNYEYFIYLFWNFNFITIIISDVEERKIYTFNLLLLAVAGLLINFFSYENFIVLVIQVFTSLLVLIFLVIIQKIYYHFRKVDGLGIGDSILISIVCLWQGLPMTLLIVTLSSVTAIFYIMIFHRRNSKKYLIPFGSFIGFICLLVPLINLNLF